MLQVQKNKSEFGLTILIIILSGASASLLLLPPLGIIPYVTFRDIAIIPSVIIIFAVGILSRSKFPRLTSRIFKGMVAGASCGPIGVSIMTTFGIAGASTLSFLYDYEIPIRLVAIAILSVTYIMMIKGISRECKLSLNKSDSTRSDS